MEDSRAKGFGVVAGDATRNRGQSHARPASLLSVIDWLLRCPLRMFGLVLARGLIRRPDGYPVYTGLPLFKAITELLSASQNVRRPSLRDPSAAFLVAYGLRRLSNLDECVVGPET